MKNELILLTKMILSTKHLSTDWKAYIDLELKKDYFQSINQFLQECQDPIFPPVEKIFRAFSFFNIEDTRVVIFGQDPYHGEHEANGLSFSVNADIKTPPSLRNIFKKIEKDFAIKRINPDLSDWAQQGFLMLNTTLTVSKDKPASHAKIGWINFTKSIIHRLNNNNQPILFILWGNHAQSLAPFIDQSKHQIIASCHPSPLAATRCGFFDNDTFKLIDKFMLENYNCHVKW